jgi:hypothetical protein
MRKPKRTEWSGGNSYPESSDRCWPALEQDLEWVVGLILASYAEGYWPELLASLSF